MSSTTRLRTLNPNIKSENSDSESSSLNVSDEDDTSTIKKPPIRKLNNTEAKHTKVKLSLQEDDISRPIPGIKNVYLAKEEGESGYYKIGNSKNPLGRVTKGNTFNPRKLEVIACCPGDSKLETKFHREYVSKRVNGEWFKFNSVEILEVIDKYRSIRPESNRTTLHPGSHFQLQRVKVNLEFHCDDEKYKMDSFLKMFSSETLKDETVWDKIGKVIYNIEGQENGLTTFIKFSQSIYDENKCRDIWLTFEGNLLSVKTLAWLAKYYNTDAYDKWHTVWVTKALELAFETEVSNSDIAELIYKHFWLDCVYTGIKSNEWYFYDKHYYKETHNAKEFYKTIVDKFFPVLKEIRTKATLIQCSLPHNGESRFKKKELEKKIDEVGKIFALLEKEVGRNKIIKLCEDLFYEKNFLDKVNIKQNIIAWGNCVTEIFQKRIYLRAGIPEDFLTVHSETKYRHDFHLNHPIIKEFLSYLHEVFVDSVLRHFFEKYLSSILMKSNKDFLTKVWIGDENSGISDMIKLLSRWLGDLFAFPSEKINISTLLAIVENYDKKGAKSSTESFSHEIICLGQSTLFITNPNVVPILFLSSWQKNAPFDLEERYKKRVFEQDDNFNSKVPRFAEALLWFAIYNFDTYIIEGLKVP